MKHSQIEMGISEAQLSSLTNGVDDLHRSTFPAVMESAREMGADFARASRTRRTILLGGLGFAGVGVLAACGSSSSTKATATPSASAAAAGTYTGDYQVVALAAALENLAVAGYGMVLKAATAGSLGTVPPAIATFVQTAMSQHADHAKAWNSVLTTAKLPAVTGTPLTITDSTVAAVMGAKTVTAAAKVAVGLEQAAAETYLEAVGAVSSPGGISVAASIAPVEAMHAAILNYVLGNYPVPDSFLPQDMAVKPSALTA